MDNFSGDSRAILSNKLKKLVVFLDKQNSREIKLAILSQLLLASENPAFYSAMIVSLKKSGSLGGYAKEMNSPSFPIDNQIAPVDNKPSPYLVGYQPTISFVDHIVEKTYSDMPTPINVDILLLKRGQSVVSRIISGR